jgi:FAD/FMN-containing dehydrogenase
VGLLGPGLGGGHGRLEGQYGLVSDNFINLNVVLASGEAIKVNAKSHADLFWAMKGAGHNFGIVTSFQMNIHPRLVDTWHYHNYVWSEDKLETVFEELHNNGSTPVLMAVNFGEFVLDTNISSTKVSQSLFVLFLFCFFFPL